MGHRTVALLLTILIAPAAVLASPRTPSRVRDRYCTGDYSRAAPRVGAPLRFGIDPGLAGSVGIAQRPTVSENPARDLAAVRALHAPGRALVVRLNRLFWSGGRPLLDRFRVLARRYARAGLDVEIQVRYHPGRGQEGDLAAWRAYVRHVVDVLGPNRRVVAMTITNEVNVAFSPNTSDGAYARARDALIEGIETAHVEAVRRGFRQLRFGFTFAYRFSPPADAAMFTYLARHGGRRLRTALGFVGLDIYPGSVYPARLEPGDSFGVELTRALGTMRRCLMPMAGIGAATPIWITEDGVPSGTPYTPTAQAHALQQLVRTARAYSATFGVTDYRWFNLRDSESPASRPITDPGALFATDGLLRADYGRKPAFGAYRAAIATVGARS